MASAGGSGGSTLHSVTENQKRWVVFGIALSKVLVPQIRPFVETEIQKEYVNLRTGHGIHAQSISGRLKHWPNLLKYENINGNDTIPKLAGGRYDYSKFDCQVMSHVDFAKLYVENHMAKFNAFDEHCDASAILRLLGKVPVFSVDVQSAAGAVREARNDWAHCVFGEWDPVNYQQKFDAMEKLVNKLGLPGSLTNDLLKELKEWETKGTILYSNATMDPDLLKLVQQHVHDLMIGVEKLSFEVQEDRERVSLTLEELQTRLDQMQLEQGTITQDLSQKIECVEQRVSQLENQEASSLKSSTDVMSHQCHSTVSAEISMFDADITFFSKRHDPDTRHWFFDDFNAWFRDPGDSRAYVLLGDPGVGKSVIAGALAQRMRETGQLGAAYFCRHDDGTRNDPRYLLGTVAHQLCACNDKYKEIVGGEDGVKMLLGNSKLGVKELFTKLLDELLSKSRPCHQKLLVIIDALDETDYESREDFLDLIQHRFPMLPEWLLFFVTSLPEDSVRSRLKRYNPCIKICAGTSEQQNFYQQHEQDIQNFLKKRIGSYVTISVDDISQKCDGLFLYAYYIVKELEDAIVSGKEISNLNNFFPGGIEEFFRKNFRRVYDNVGESIFKKLFGCAIVAPSPLPVSVIPFILNKENSKLDKQQVIDAVSQFLVLRTPNQTLSFLHNLVPTWLTNDTKAPPKLFISKKTAGEYLKEIVVEILSSIFQESSSPYTSVHAKLEDYVIRVAVSFLCHFGGKDWLELVFTCLTNYHFVERRLRSGKIEIYRLLQDLKRVSGCLDGDDKKKQDLLQEVAQVLLSNTFVLAECPQLLHSCLRKASNAVQETFLPYKLPVPWLECTVIALQDPAIADMNCFATSSDERTIVGAAGRTLMFFDTRTTRRVNGPFEISKQIIDNISHLEYSPDNQFIFFGRLDKWFSVERECIEDFLQFDGNATVYQWGFRTRDGESIVVKRNVENFACHCPENTCLCNLLALWAVKEIEKSRDGVMSLQKELAVEGPVNCLLKCLSYKTYPAETRVMSLHEGLAIEGPMNRLLKCLSYKTYPAETRVELESLLGGCHFCYKLSSRIGKGYEEASLTAVRQKILEIYPFIFQCQIWDLKMGRPVLERAFIPNVQLEPFTYICHVSNFVNRWAMEIACSDVSVCNIAIITAIRYLEGSLGHRLQREPPVDLKPAVIPQLSAECTDRVEELLEDLLERDMALGLAEELKRKVNVNLETVLKRIKELEEQQRMKLEQISGLEQELDLKDEIVFLLRLKRVLNPEVESIRLCMALDLEPKLEEELKMLIERERVLEHGLIGRNRGLEIDQQELNLNQGLKFPLDQLHKSHNKLACLEELQRILERRRGQEFKQLEGNSTTEKKLESLLTKKQERYDSEVAYVGLAGDSGILFETLEGREQYLMHKMEIELNRKRNHEVKGAQCWTAWEENELMLKGREHLMMKKFRRLRLNLLARKLKKQLEQVLKHKRYRSRGLSYSLERLHFEGIGVWEPYLRVLKEEKMEMDPNLARELQHGSIECEDCTNLPEWLHDVESIVNEHIFICHSPGGKWVLEADGFRNKHILRKRNRELSCDHETPQRDIEKFTRFSFTKNDSYFVYLTDNGLLHALSLETGAVLTSLPNNQIMYFTRQVPHACGYFFCSDTKEKVILLSDLFSPFKFIPASPVELAVVEKTIAAVFCSTNTVLAVGSDLNVSFWQTPEAQDGFSFISKSLLNTSGLQVKNCALSPNGQHIAIYQGSKLMLYTMTDFTLAETDTVFEEQFGCTVSSLTFSGDSASLLLCIQAFPNFTRGDVWDVVGKVVSSSVKSQNLFTVECCCLLSDKQEVILCGQYQIEIWKYGESSCHLLTLIHVEKIYHSLRFTQCIVSSDNQLLVCCIANTILIYRRNTSNVNSSKRVLHGHLGKIEFFQFLKEDRYLISYGIDGMVFLWDTSGQEDRCKAVGFTKIPLDTVVCMAVSPDEEKIVCFSSINLMCLVKLCNLKSFSQ